MRDLAVVSSDESTVCLFEQYVLHCDQWYHDGLEFFFHYLLL